MTVGNIARRHRMCRRGANTADRIRNTLLIIKHGVTLNACVTLQLLKSLMRNLCHYYWRLTAISPAAITCLARSLLGATGKDIIAKVNVDDAKFTTPCGMDGFATPPNAIWSAYGAICSWIVDVRGSAASLGLQRTLLAFICWQESHHCVVDTQLRSAINAIYSQVFFAIGVLVYLADVCL